MWAILDSARSPRAAYYARFAGFESECLFAGDLDDELRYASPYLVRLEFDDPRTVALISESWGSSWGIFLKSDVGMKTLRQHLRTLLRVRLPNGHLVLFRFYDPRVLRIYLPSCTPSEVNRFSGPVLNWWAEGGNQTNAMFAFRTVDGRLTTSTIPCG